MAGRAISATRMSGWPSNLRCSRIFNPAVHSIVVAFAFIQPALTIAGKSIGRHVSHPLFKINNLADLGKEVSIGNTCIVELVYQIEYVRKVILGTVGLLGIVVTVIIGIRSRAGSLFVIKVRERLAAPH